MMLLSLCVAVVFIHLVYYLIIFNFFNFTKPQALDKNNIPVSLIVCAKNEAENLKKNLPFIIEQKYFCFELVLIDDRSHDKTTDLFKTLESKHDFIKVITVKESEHFRGNKKYALTLGIKAASHDCLLFTDADCIPKSEYWIQEMANAFTGQTKIVLGYGSYKTIPNSFLNKVIRYETLMTALQYFSFAKIGTPYMGVGRNLMYSKEVFLKNKGFNKHIKIMSGDDDLLINQISTKQNTKLSFDEQTHTISEPKTNLSSWLVQKKRHISTADLYQTKHKFLLGLYAFNRTVFLFLIPFGIAYIEGYKNQLLFYGCVFVKFLSEYIVVGLAAKKLKEKKFILLIPLLDVCLLFFQLYILVESKINKTQKWS